MSDTQKKQNFLQGTALLAMAAMFVKLVGALYKVPLNAIIGEKGFGCPAHSVLYALLKGQVWDAVVSPRRALRRKTIGQRVR